MSILVVDIGNTSTSLARYQKGAVGRAARVMTRTATEEQIQKAARQAAGRSAPRAVCIASVVPPVDELWASVLKDLFGVPVEFVHCRLRLPVPLRYPSPASIGADRLANAAGGVARYGKPLIVADFGTAVTFDVITERGYEGGIIAPGWPLVFDYLSEKTAKLPRLVFRPARGRWGRSTEEAIRLGAQWGYPALVEGILSKLRRVKPLARAPIVVTGGHGAFVAEWLREKTVVDPSLTLFGIGRIYELNFGPA